MMVLLGGWIVAATDNEYVLLAYQFGQRFIEIIKVRLSPPNEPTLHRFIPQSSGEAALNCNCTHASRVTAKQQQQQLLRPASARATFL